MEKLINQLLNILFPLEVDQTHAHLAYQAASIILSPALLYNLTKRKKS